MTRTLAYFHGAGPRGEASAQLQRTLVDNLRPQDSIVAPSLPAPEDPDAQAWCDVIRQTLSGPDAPRVVVGHSLGASTVLKVLCEGGGGDVARVALLAPPYWGMPEWDNAAFALPPDAPRRLREDVDVTLVVPGADALVPPSHGERYAREFGWTPHVVEGADHSFQNRHQALGAWWRHWLEREAPSI